MWNDLRQDLLYSATVLGSHSSIAYWNRWRRKAEVSLLFCWLCGFLRGAKAVFSCQRLQNRIPLKPDRRHWSELESECLVSKMIALCVTANIPKNIIAVAVETSQYELFRRNMEHNFTVIKVRNPCMPLTECKIQCNWCQWWEYQPDFAEKWQALVEKCLLWNVKLRTAPPTSYIRHTISSFPLRRGRECSTTPSVWMRALRMSSKKRVS